MFDELGGSGEPQGELDETVDTDALTLGWGREERTRSQLVELWNF